MSLQTQAIRAAKPDQSLLAGILMLAFLSPVAWWIADHAAYGELSSAQAMPIAMLGTAALLSAVGAVVTPRKRWAIVAAAALISFAAATMLGNVTRIGSPSIGFLSILMAGFGALCGPLFIRGETAGLRFCLALLVWMMIGFAATTQSYAHGYMLDRQSAERIAQSPVLIQRLETVVLPMLLIESSVIWEKQEVTKDSDGRFESYHAQGTFTNRKGDITAHIHGGVVNYTIGIKSPEAFSWKIVAATYDSHASAKKWLSGSGFRDNGYRLKNLKNWRWSYIGPRAPGQVEIEVANGHNILIHGVINPDWM